MNDLIYLMPPFLGFAFATSITPGMNNLMLTSSGINFGVRASLPHLLGIVFGFFFLMAAVALGLGVLFNDSPKLQLALKYIGSAYLIYLAIKIYRTSSLGDDNDSKKITFFEAALFQLVNPKVWGMAISAMSSFTAVGELYLSSAALISILFVLVYLPCGATWLLFGALLKKHLSKKHIFLIFNKVMAVMLMISVVLIFN